MNLELGLAPLTVSCLILICNIISFVGGSQEMLADSITEILQPEDVEKLETALQSEHAKEILGDVVLGEIPLNLTYRYYL